MPTGEGEPAVTNTTKLWYAIRKSAKESCKYIFEFKKLEKIAFDEALLNEFCNSIKGFQLSGRSGLLRGKKSKEVKDIIKKRISDAQEKIKGKKSWENGCPVCNNETTEICVVCISRVLEEVEKQHNKKKEF